MGTGHSYPASRSVPCCRERFARHALPLPRTGTPGGACSSARKKWLLVEVLLVHDRAEETVPDDVTLKKMSAQKRPDTA
jgi:hypothetical protein